MVKIDNDIMVLANPEIADLPGWVIALVVAGGLAAALSTAAGLLLAISSSVSHDLLKGIVMPNISDRQELNAGRASMIGAIALAGYLGIIHLTLPQEPLQWLLVWRLHQFFRFLSWVSL